MSRNLPNMASRYTASWAPWRYAKAQDAYGNTSSWVSGMNSGILPTVLSGYQKASNTFLTYSQSCFRHATKRSRAGAVRAATVQLVDGAAQTAMQMIGKIRANALSTVNTIRNIQSDSFSNNPDLNY